MRCTYAPGIVIIHLSGRILASRKSRKCQASFSGCFPSSKRPLSSCRVMDPKTFLTPYKAPQWAIGKFSFIPKWKVELARLPTPIQEWKLDGIPDNFSISIKRDDLTGSTLSGNKVRKLEFLLADAISQDYGCVITCGSIQSNHCRTTAVSAKQFGLDTHLLLRSGAEDPDEIDCSGNLLLDRMVGAHIHLVPKNTMYDTGLDPKMVADNGLIPRMTKLSDKIREKTGKKSYLIPIGGSNKVGLYGYINAFQELLDQGLEENFDDIIMAVGSGGTVAGLAIANYLTGSKIRVHAAAVCDNAAYFHAHINDMLTSLDVTVRSEDIVNIFEGAKGRGYGLSTPEELDFIVQTSLKTGIFVDPCYSGKAAKCMVDQINQNPDAFQGKRILFLHTGGLYGLFDGRMDDVLKASKVLDTNRVHVWSDGTTSPIID